MTAQLHRFTEREAIEQAGIADIEEQLYKELLMDTIFHTPHYAVTCCKHMHCNTCMQQDGCCQWVSFQWLVLCQRVQASCPGVLLSCSGLMLVSAAVALISLAITKKSSNLVKDLCNDLCSLSRTNLKGDTVVHTAALSLVLKEKPTPGRVFCFAPVIMGCSSPLLGAGGFILPHSILEGTGKPSRALVLLLHFRLFTSSLNLYVYVARSTLTCTGLPDCSRRSLVGENRLCSWGSTRQWQPTPWVRAIILSLNCECT